MPGEYYDRVFAGVDDVPAAQWSALCSATAAGADAAGPFMDLRFLRALATTESANTRFWPAMIFDEHDRPVACAWLTQLRVDGAMVAGRRGRRWTERLRRLFPNYLFLKLLLCGSPVSSGQSGLRIHPDADATKVVAAIDRVLVRLGKERGMQILAAKELDAASCERLATMSQLGYLRADSLPANVFEPRFASFDDARAAMENRCRWEVNFKSRLGCHQEARYFFIKARSRLLAGGIGLFRKLMFPAAPPRSQRDLFAQERTSLPRGPQSAASR